MSLCILTGASCGKGTGTRRVSTRGGQLEKDSVGQGKTGECGEQATERGTHIIYIIIKFSSVSQTNEKVYCRTPRNGDL